MVRSPGSQLIAIAAAIGALILTGPTTAQANAVGTTPVATFDYAIGGATVKVPTGCAFTHIIRGAGKTIRYQNAGVDCAFVAALTRGFCNWRIDFTYADTNNKMYSTSRGKTHAECRIDPMRNNAPQVLAHSGKACAHLSVNGIRRVSQCHYITK
jgi:hypothetical protein